MLDVAVVSLAPGDTVYVPRAVFISTLNTGREPLRLLTLYNLGGAEKTLEGLPNFRELLPGQVPSLEFARGAATLTVSLLVHYLVERLACLPTRSPQAAGCLVRVAQGDGGADHTSRRDA